MVFYDRIKRFIFRIYCEPDINSNDKNMKNTIKEVFSAWQIQIKLSIDPSLFAKP